MLLKLRSYHKYIWIFLLISWIRSVTSWDFAVTTKNKILFYNSSWDLLTSAAHQFSDISAFAFDEVDEVIYFNDLVHGDGSIFKLRILLNDENNHRIEKLVHKQRNESIQGIAFDPLDRRLYWSDALNKKIYSYDVNSDSTMGKPEEFLNVPSSTPHGLALDVCRRTLFWTNQDLDDPSVEGLSLDKKVRKVLAKQDLYKPYGITIDHYTERVYWVNDVKGSAFIIEHSQFDGSDRRILYQGTNNDPHHLAVDREYVYWTDKTNNAIWRISKMANYSEHEQNEKPIKVINYDSAPKSILIRTHFVSVLEDHPECKSVMEHIRKEIIKSNKVDKNEYTLVEKEIDEMSCLNGGIHNSKSNTCVCSSAYVGKYCELPKCHNYCLNGICTMSSTGYPQCKCPEGFDGERCERDLCSGFCLNGGHCELKDGLPMCLCSSFSFGKHCEIIQSEQLCEEYCFKGLADQTWILPELCERCNENRTSDLVRNNILVPEVGSDVAPDRVHKDEISSQCPITAVGGWNGSVVAIGIITLGVIISLSLMFAIVRTIRKYYRPRPKIKKKFVVRKSPVTDMTCRPGTTEQCEITIEDCCNMNICETPCFDPKSLQESSKRDDKIKLLNPHGDGELF